MTAMAGIRAEIDRLDRDLVALLARRAALIDGAVAVKRRENLPARIEARVDEVIANARAAAVVEGLDPDLVGEIWERLVEWSIAREEAALGEGGR